jgi:hypothetical protein
MTLQSVVDVAEAVSRLAERHEVRFEINTRSYWLRVNGARLLGLRGVSVTSRALDTAAYRKWLAGADVALIAYNFDDRTRRYVQTSMANKAPECLASGAAVLGYGPPDFNTIAELAALGCAELVTSRDPAALDAALLRLLKDDDRRVALGESGRRVAFTRFNLPSIRKAFTDRFRDLAAAGQAQDLDALETERAALEERLRTLGREIARRRARRPAPDQRADAVEAAWAALTWLPVPLAGVAAGQSAPQRGPHQVAQAADARTGAS